jgi:hypothetical protein
LETLSDTIRAQLLGNGHIELDTNLPLIVQETIDYFLFDRPSFRLKGEMVDCADLALLEESDIADNSIPFLNSVYIRLGQKILKAYDAHCVESVSVLSCHRASKFFVSVL